jgi:Zinc-binding dehydrogenase
MKRWTVKPSVSRARSKLSISSSTPSAARCLRAPQGCCERAGGWSLWLRSRRRALADKTKVAYFVVEPSPEQLAELARLVDDGTVRPTIDSVYPLAEARSAFPRSMMPGKRGKVVVRDPRLEDSAVQSELGCSPSRRSRACRSPPHPLFSWGISASKGRRSA